MRRLMTLACLAVVDSEAFWKLSGGLLSTVRIEALFVSDPGGF